MTTVYIILAIVAIFLIVLAAPLIFGRIFIPGLTLSLVVKFGKRMAKLTDRIKPGLDIKLLVKAVNRYFRDQFAKTPFSKRILFIPFCLRPKDCPAKIDADQGLMCTGGCKDCELGVVRDEALKLGYGQVWIVPSSTMLKKLNLPKSDHFIRRKITASAPCAALGVVCDWHLRNRLLPDHKVDGRGYVSSSDGSTKGSVLQGVLLDCKNCRQATVDWNAVREKMCIGAPNL